MPGVRDAVEGYATELVLGDFLDELLSDPFRERARERLTRGWEAAVGQPRYGPNGVAVRALLDRLAQLDPAGVTALGGVGPQGRSRRPVRRALAARDLARRRRGAAGLVGPGRTRRGRGDPDRGGRSGRRSRARPARGRARRAPARPAPCLRADRVRQPDPPVAAALPAGRAAGGPGPPSVASRLTRLCDARRMEARLVAVLAVIALVVVSFVAVREWRRRVRLERVSGAARGADPAAAVVALRDRAVKAELEIRLDPRRPDGFRACPRARHPDRRRGPADRRRQPRRPRPPRRPA